MEEILDIFNEDGSWRGTAPRTQVHQNGYWHKTAQVWLLNEFDELLLQLRSDLKDCFPSLWDISSAGHIPAGEKPINSAVRELEEELGVKCSESDLLHLFTMSEPFVDAFSGSLDNEISLVYLLRVKKDTDFILQEEEVSAIRWLPYKSLVREYSENAASFVPHETHFNKLVETLQSLIDS